MSYLVHLQQFEGPLGLLLYLIRKEEMDIFDINVGDITNQYLDYIRQMKELDLEVAGEFVAMAATLIQIKSRMLLPQYNAEGEPVELEDPRKELVQKLLDYQKYQEAAKQLYERPLLGRDVFLRGTRENLYDSDEGEIIIEDDGLFSLISAYRKSVRRALKAVHRVKAKVQSIAERVMEIQHKLIVGTRVMLSDLIQIGEAPRRTQLLVTFLSMLELGRMGYVSLFQSDTYGEIYVDPLKSIERNVLERVQEFDSGDAEAIAKSIMAEAEEEKIDMAEAMQSAHDLVGDHVQLGLGESNEGPEHIADVEFAEALLRGETLAPEHVASDDEIFAAELEMDRGAWAPDADAVVAADAAGSEQVAAVEDGAGADVSAELAADQAAVKAVEDSAQAEFVAAEELAHDVSGEHFATSVADQDFAQTKSEELMADQAVTADADSAQAEFVAADVEGFAQAESEEIASEDAVASGADYAAAEELAHDVSGEHFATSVADQDFVLTKSEELMADQAVTADADSAQAEFVAASTDEASAPIEASEHFASQEAVGLADDEVRAEFAAEAEASADPYDAPYEVSSDYANNETVLETVETTQPSNPEEYASFADSLATADETLVEVAADEAPATEQIVASESDHDHDRDHAPIVELKSDDDVFIEPVVENDQPIEQPMAASSEQEHSAEPERGFHAETGNLNNEDLIAEHDNTLPANHPETRSGEGSAEA